jgi:hypothetical protein
MTNSVLHPMTRARLFSVVLSLGAGGIVACGQSSATTSAPPTVAASALTSSQCSARSFDGAVSGCADAFASCAQAPGADVNACKTALEACLPQAPSSAFAHGGPGGNDGDADDGVDGGAPDPTHGDGGCDRGPGGGHGGHGDHGDHGGHRPAPDPAAIKACHDQLLTCVSAAGADVTACFDADHACTQAAFAAAFQAECANVATECAGVTSDRCTQALARCAAGENGGPDGGTICP